MKIVDKIKELWEEIKDTVDWIAAGCPKPQPIKIPTKDNKKRRR